MEKFKPKVIRFFFTCICGRNEVDDTEEPLTKFNHKDMLKMDYRYRKFKDGSHYYLMKNHSEQCECFL